MRISDWSSDVCSSDLCLIEPVVGELEAAVRLAQHLPGRQPAIVEGEDAVVIAVMRHRVVAPADHESGGAAVDQKAGDLLLGAGCGRLLTRGDEDDDEIGDGGVADEVLADVQHPVAAVGWCRALPPAAKPEE